MPTVTLDASQAAYYYNGSTAASGDPMYGQVTSKGTLNYGFAMKWDVSSIASGSTIQSAYVQAYLNQNNTVSGQHSFNTYNINNAWEAYGVAPTFDATVLGTHDPYSRAINAYYTIIPDAANIRSLVSAWVNGTTTNHGLGAPYYANTTDGTATYNGLGKGNPPQLVVTYVTTPGAPGAPTLGNNATKPNVDVSWTAASGSPTGYKVERALNSGFTGSTVTDVGNVLSWTDTTVAPSTTYYYRVRGYNSAGDGTNSTASSITTQAVLPPNAPADPTLTFVYGGTVQGGEKGADYVQIAWSPPATDFTHDAATSYKIQRAPDVNGSPGTFAQIANVNGSPYNDSMSGIGGLAYGFKYWYRVAGTNAGGDGLYSNAVAITIPKGAVYPVMSNQAVHRASRW